MQPGSVTDWRADFGRRLVNLRVPISGTLELTHRCNLGCVHCYLGSRQDRQHSAEREMTTDEVLSVLDQVAAAGCLNLVLSGGEPLLRRDFAEIYRHARGLGLVVTVFSNATLVTEELVDLFRDYPPYAVDISVYGATPATYEKVTGVAGSFEGVVYFEYGHDKPQLRPARMLRFQNLEAHLLNLYFGQVNL